MNLRAHLYREFRKMFPTAVHIEVVITGDGIGVWVNDEVYIGVIDGDHLVFRADDRAPIQLPLPQEST